MLCERECVVSVLCDTKKLYYKRNLKNKKLSAVSRGGTLLKVSTNNIFESVNVYMKAEAGAGCVIGAQH